MTHVAQTAELHEALTQVPGVLVRAGEPMARHMPLRLGGPAELWATVDDLPALVSTLSAARKGKTNWRVHWPFGDWLVRDGGVRGLVLRLGQGFEAVRYEEGQLWIGAAALWTSLAGRPLAEVPAALSTWPGSVGGLVSGPERERLAGLVGSVRWLRGRKVEQVDLEPGEAPPELPKSAVLLEIALRPEPCWPKGRRRKALSPPPPQGALFEAPDGEPVGRLLTRAGLGSARLRSWRVTPEGTLVQLGDGTCKDALLLAQGLQERVEKERGITLQTRLPVVGTDPRAEA